MANQVPPLKNSSYIFYMGLVQQADSRLLQANPTIAAGDFKVSIDGGALNNLTTLPSVSPAGSTMVKVDLSAAEMNGDNITVVAIDAAGAEWSDTIVNIQTVNDVTYGEVTMSRLIIQGTNANGVLYIENTGTGHAAHLIGAGAAKNAVKLVSDNGDALDITSSNSRGALIKAGGGDALKLEGGLTDGAAIHLAGGTTNGDAIKTAPQGTGEHISGVVDVGFINGNSTAAARLATSSALMEIGTVASGTPSATTFITDLTEATDDHYNDRILYFTSGANIGQAKAITDYVGGSKTIVCNAFTDAPALTDAFIII